VNAGQLQAWFSQNQKPVLGVAAAGAVGLGVLRARRAKAAAGGSPTGGSSAGTAFATGPAVAGTTTPYDSSVVDGYNALQDQLYALNDRLNTPTPVPAAPKASKMFAPDPGNTNWIVMPNGVNGQVQDDGSVFGATATQFFASGGQLEQRSPVSNNLDWYSTERNAATAAKSSTS
jgi:hypothetical protein